MARVLVYERSIDLGTIDPAFYQKNRFNVDDILGRIKSEPVTEEDNIETFSNQEDSLVVSTTSINLNDYLQNKENDSTSSRNYANLESNKEENISPGKCKRNNSEKVNSPQHEHLTKKRKRLYEIRPNFLSDNPESTPIERDVREMGRRNTCMSVHNIDKLYVKAKKVRRSHACNVCYLRYTKSNVLKNHMKRFAKRRPLKCSYCGIFAKTSEQLTHHVKECLVAKGRRPFRYTCDFCQQGFSHKRLVQIHIFHTHNDEMNASTYSVKSVDCKNMSLCDRMRAAKSNTLKLNWSGNLKSNNDSHDKKLRQPTLPEFLLRSPTVKQEQYSPPKSDDLSPNTSQNITFHELSATRPFVKIHINTESMKTLLDGNTNNDEEHKDHYSLRSTKINNSQSLNSTSTSKKVKAKCSSELTGIASLLSRYKCQDFTILLKKCDVKEKCSNPSEEISRDYVEDCESDLVLKEVEVCLEKLPHINTQMVKSELAANNVDYITDVDTYYKCKICSKVFSSKKEKRDHKKSTHTLYMSSLCKAHFKTKNGLILHYLRRHSFFKVPKCCICHEVYERRVSLIKHLELHCIRVYRLADEMSSGFNRSTCTHCRGCGTNSCLKQFENFQQLLKERIGADSNLENNDPCITSSNEETNEAQPILVSEDTTDIDIPVTTTQDTNTTMQDTNTTTENANITRQNSNTTTQDTNTTTQDTNKTTQDTYTTTQDADTTQPLLGNLTTNSSQHEENIVENTVPEKSNDVQAFKTQSSPTQELSIFEGSDLETRLPLNVILTEGISSYIPASEAPVLVQRRSPLKQQLNGGRLKYPCCVCGKRFQTFDNLSRHLRYFSTSASEVCELCNTAFGTSRLLKEHMSRAHVPAITQTYTLHCRYCNQGFYKKGNLKMHELHLHISAVNVNSMSSAQLPEQGWSFDLVCSVCHLVFGNYDRFVEHNVYYYKGHVYPCAFCDQTFNGMYMLNHHNKLAHYAEEMRKEYTFVCDICNEGFKHETHYLAHKVHVHSCEPGESPAIWNVSEEQITPYNILMSNQDNSTLNFLYANTRVCDICKLDFPTPADLNIHKVEYSNDGEFQCYECHRKCHTLQALATHRSLNHLETCVDNGYKCPTCKEILISSVSLMSHEQHFHKSVKQRLSTHIRDLWNMDFSNKSSINSTLLNTSIDLASCETAYSDTSIENGKRDFSCQTCGMSFLTQHDLKGHLAEYANTGIHVCQQCGKKFEELIYLEKHKLKHSRMNGATANHHCPICSEEFSTPKNVTAHILHMHSCQRLVNLAIPPTKTAESSGAEKNQQIPSSVNNIAEKSQSVFDPLNSTSIVNLIDTEGNKDQEKTVDGKGKSPNPITIEPVVETDDVQQSETMMVICSSSLSEKLNDSPNAITSTASLEKIRCEICRLKFQNADSLEYHKKRYRDVQSYVCNICDKRMPRNKEFRIHYGKHMNACPELFKNMKYECFYCKEKFFTSAACRSHMYHVHDFPSRKDILEQFLWKDKRPVGTIEDGNRNDQVIFDNTDFETEMTDPLAIDAVDLETESAETTTQNGQLASSGNAASTSNWGKLEKNADKKKNEGENTKTSPKIKCPICLFEYQSLSYFKLHFKEVHPNLSKKCSKETPGDRLASTSDIVRCLICNTFFCEEALARHVQDVHGLHLGDAHAKNTRRVNISDNIEPIEDADAPCVIWERGKPSIPETITIPDDDSDTSTVIIEPSDADDVLIIQEPE